MRKKLDNVNVMYRTFSFTNYEVCEECYKNLDLIVTEYEKQSDILTEKQNELFKDTKNKIDELHVKVRLKNETNKMR